MIFKTWLKSKNSFVKITSFIYSTPVIILNLVSLQKSKAIIREVYLKNTRFIVTGQNIKIIIGKNSIIKKSRFYCKGDNITIKIGSNARINNTSFYCEDDNSSIIIGKGFTMEGGHIASTEGENIIIGDDCMFSSDIEIRNGDSHSIFLVKENNRINYAKQVSIGFHVWLCAHSRIMKGSVIPNNSIIANSAIVSGILKEGNSIYGGSPARQIKKNINWSRERLPKK